MSDPVFTVAQAVAVINQTLETVYPTITIVGELAEFKIAKGRWLYADIKDEDAKLRLFGTIYQMPGPLEDGMMVEIVGEPRLHPQFGFSINLRSIRPVGEGSIKRAANLLQAKLEAEGLFASERKRAVTRGPVRIGLITSEQSAAYADFIKIMNQRWQGVDVELYNVAVQGEAASAEIVQALSYFSQQAEAPEVVVLIRGGGSADDLSVFSAEQVVRAVAASRIPTLVAIGHEVDVSLSELAADLRASTPSNAAELLFPDKNDVGRKLELQLAQLGSMVRQELAARSERLKLKLDKMSELIASRLDLKSESLNYARRLLESAHPKSNLKRGFAIVQSGGKLVRSSSQLKSGQSIDITLQDGRLEASVREAESRSGVK